MVLLVGSKWVWIHNRILHMFCICGWCCLGCTFKLVSFLVHLFGFLLYYLPDWHPQRYCWVFWIFPLGSSMPPCTHLIDWIVGFLVMDSIVHKIKSRTTWKVASTEDIFGIFFLGKTLLCQIFFPLLSWGCMSYGICNFPLLVKCNSCLLHVVPIISGRLFY